MMLISDFV